MISLASEREDPPSAEAEDAARHKPQVFVRVFAVPSGLPWEQSRAAELDARHGSPLPIHELLYQLKRLEGWGPGKAARYAVFYIRAQDYEAPFETTEEVEGRLIQVAFGVRKQDVDRAKLAATVALLIVLCGAILGGAVMMALNARSEAFAKLETTEQLAAAKRRMALTQQKQVDQARSLRAEVGRARPLNEVLADLEWAASSKSPDARISALHWDHGMLAVEARGKIPPLISSDRPLQRAETPLRPGVWLWGLDLRAAGASPGARP